MPEKQWEQDDEIGLLVDLDKGLLQFFLNRKKHGPVVHLPNLPILAHGKEFYFCVALNTGKFLKVVVDFVTLLQKEKHQLKQSGLHLVLKYILDKVF